MANFNVAVEELFKCLAFFGLDCIAFKKSSRICRLFAWVSQSLFVITAAHLWFELAALSVFKAELNSYGETRSIKSINSRKTAQVSLSIEFGLPLTAVKVVKDAARTLSQLQKPVDTRNLVCE